jgi:hypothetical protein
MYTFISLLVWIYVYMYIYITICIYVYITRIIYIYIFIEWICAFFSTNFFVYMYICIYIYKSVFYNYIYLYNSLHSNNSIYILYKCTYQWPIIYSMNINEFNIFVKKCALNSCISDYYYVMDNHSGFLSEISFCYR